jgi:hypothetical protein
VAPERIDGMVRALLQDYVEGGFMPKWPNPSYTNIMIATHADSLVAEAVNKGFKDFDLKLAYAAVAKDATTPPDGDTTRRWADREPNVPYEARAGLSYSLKLGYIPPTKLPSRPRARSRTPTTTMRSRWWPRRRAMAGYRHFLARSMTIKSCTTRRAASCRRAISTAVGPRRRRLDRGGPMGLFVRGAARHPGDDQTAGRR